MSAAPLSYALAMRSIALLCLALAACGGESRLEPVDAALDTGAEAATDSGPLDTTADGDAAPNVEDEVDQYLRADEPSTALLDELDGKYRDVPFAVFEAAVRKHRPLPLAAGLSTVEWTNPMLTAKVRYEVYVPTKIAGPAVERVPLLLFLHWAGGDGPAVVADATIRAAADALGAVLVAPTAELCDWSMDERCMSQVVLLLQRLKRKLPIDDDRVVVSGFSMGGRGSFSAAAAYPSAFAGVVPVAGSIGAISSSSDVAAHQKYCCPHAENLGNLRLHYLSGALDLPALLNQNRGCDLCLAAQGAEYRYEEIPGIGHELPPKEWTAAITWAFAEPRTPYPAKVVFDLAPQLSSKVPGGVTFHQELAPAEYWAFLDARVDTAKPARVQATQAGNDVELTTTNAAKVAVYLSTTAFDLGKNVRVRSAGTVLLDELVRPDRRLLLTEARARSERSVTYAAKRVVAMP